MTEFENNKALQESLLEIYEVLRITDVPKRIPDEHEKELSSLGLIEYEHWDDGEEHSIGGMMAGAGEISGYVTTELGNVVCEFLTFTQEKNPYLGRWLKFVATVRQKSRIRLFEKYKEIKALYSESHRAYHTFDHITDCLDELHCLDELEDVWRLAKNPRAVEMAIWYHDAIYDPKAKDNEEKSAELALKVAQETSLSSDFGQKVANLILATKHDKIPVEDDAKLICDIDLSILGQTESVFDRYERQIRKEYSWVSNEVFAAERFVFLKSLLERPTIYLTEFFRDKYELLARRNIRRSLARFSKTRS